MNNKLDPEKVKKALQIAIAILSAILGGIGGACVTSMMGGF